MTKSRILYLQKNTSTKLNNKVFYSACKTIEFDYIMLPNLSFNAITMPKQIKDEMILGDCFQIMENLVLFDCLMTNSLFQVTHSDT